MPVSISPEDPRSPDIVALLERHLAFSYETTEAEFVFALDVDRLCVPAITFVAARDGGALVGVGALKRLGDGHGELKSMHTAVEARGRGVARAVVEHLVCLARGEGMTRLSLETGAQDAFGPARSLYASCGFESCGPFADYPDVPSSAFMTLPLTP